ncbi:ATP-binding cassette domain-containing protein [Rossellomorea sp. AcN35-11]|nr:ATP-binding cassette domain-containing protein [Rossellomorea aquimaris]WJV29880.1 ATP-binding cassette domain-containing protein [Rossellomorea sp. AcN35-11]
MKINIKNLTYRYPKAKTSALKNVSMSLNNKQINIVLGLNGAGKTTLFDLISGVITPPRKGIDKINKKDVLYQVQGVPFLSTLKGKDITRLFLKSDYRFGKKEITYKDLLNHHSDQYEHEKAKKIWDMELGKMSPGERRWLIITNYCRIEREIYIFDEPTVGVDPSSKMSILRQIQHLCESQQKTVILSTHILHELEFLNGEIYLLHEGEIKFKGDYKHFLESGSSKDPDMAFKTLTSTQSQSEESEYFVRNSFA